MYDRHRDDGELLALTKNGIYWTDDRETVSSHSAVLTDFAVAEVVGVTAWRLGSGVILTNARAHPTCCL